MILSCLNKQIQRTWKGKTKLEKQNIPSNAVTAVKRVSSTITPVIRENQKTPFCLNLAMHGKRGKVIYCCNVTENEGPWSASCNFIFEEAEMLKLIYIHLRAGREWKA